MIVSIDTCVVIISVSWCALHLNKGSKVESCNVRYVVRGVLSLFELYLKERIALLTCSLIALRNSGIIWKPVNFFLIYLSIFMDLQDCFNVLLIYQMYWICKHIYIYICIIFSERESLCIHSFTSSYTRFFISKFILRTYLRVYIIACQYSQIKHIEYVWL